MLAIAYIEIDIVFYVNDRNASPNTKIHFCHVMFIAYDIFILLGIVNTVQSRSRQKFILIQLLSNILLYGNCTITYLQQLDVTSSISLLISQTLVQPVMFAGLKAIFIPYVNLRLMRGFILPLLHGFTFRNGEIQYTYSKIMICSNLAFT